MANTYGRRRTSTFWLYPPAFWARDANHWVSQICSSFHQTIHGVRSILATTRRLCGNRNLDLLRAARQRSQHICQTKRSILPDLLSSLKLTTVSVDIRIALPCSNYKIVFCKCTLHPTDPAITNIIRNFYPRAHLVSVLSTIRSLNKTFFITADHWPAPVFNTYYYWFLKDSPEQNDYPKRASDYHWIRKYPPCTYWPLWPSFHASAFATVYCVVVNSVLLGSTTIWPHGYSLIHQAALI